ncbi:MAG: type II secretion system protein, partial [Pygmaiobacter sp.]
MKKLNQKGFTLLEVLIAIALLTLVAAAVYPLLSTGTQGIALAASQQKALYSSKQDVETELATAGETKISTADVEVTLRDGSGAKLDSKLAPGNYYSSTDKKISTFKAGGDSLRITPSTQEDNKSIGDYALSIYGTTFETGKKFTLERVSANDNNKVLASYDEKTVSFVINSTSTATMTLKERIPVGW